MAKDLIKYDLDGRGLFWIMGHQVCPSMKEAGGRLKLTHKREGDVQMEYREMCVNSFQKLGEASNGLHTANSSWC